MNRVRRCKRMRRKAGRKHLVDVLEPLRISQVAKPAKRDAPIGTETVERDSEKLRRAVDDHHPDGPIADLPAQPTEEDPRAAGVVDQDLTVGQVALELLERQIEVLVPAVVLDRVVVEPERVDGLRDPILVGDPLEACPVEVVRSHAVILTRRARVPSRLAALYDPRRLP